MRCESRESTILALTEQAIQAGGSTEAICKILGVSAAYVAMVAENLKGPWRHEVPYHQTSKKALPRLEDYDWMSGSELGL